MGDDDVESEHVLIRFQVKKTFFFKKNGFKHGFALLRTIFINNN